MIWPIVSVFSVCIVVAAYLVSRGPRRATGSLAGGLIGLAVSSGCLVVIEDALPHFRTLTDGRTGWNVIAGLLALMAAATFAGGLALIGHFFAQQLKAEGSDAGDKTDKIPKVS